MFEEIIDYINGPGFFPFIIFLISIALLLFYWANKKLTRFIAGMEEARRKKWELGKMLVMLAAVAYVWISMLIRAT